MILEAAGRQVPAGEWSIDVDWINAWNKHTTRPSRQGMHFTTVDYENVEGRLEMACTYEIISTTYVRGLCPQAAPESDVKLGSIYKFRPENGRGAHNPDLLFGSHATKDFVYQTFVADYVVHSFVTREESQ